MRIVSPTAILGYGFPESSRRVFLQQGFDAIVTDGGSTDPGPYYLGRGVSFTARENVKRDLEKMIQDALDKNAPLLIGTAGGSGGKPHLEWTRRIILEIAREKKYRFSFAVISAKIGKDFIRKQFETGNLTPLGYFRKSSADEIEESSHIVCQMGPEPFIKALQAGAQVILAGRANDPAPFAAVPIHDGFKDRALAIHAGKILECGAIAATPGSGSDSLVAEIRDDGFILSAPEESRSCTPVSVSSHSLYEQANPFEILGPGSKVSLNNATFTQLPDGRTKVSGSKLVEQEYSLKVEGARKIGERHIGIGEIRDSEVIKSISVILDEAKQKVASEFSWLTHGKDYHLNTIIYGRNGVMGCLEPKQNPATHELGVIIDVIAGAREDSERILHVVWQVIDKYESSGGKFERNLNRPFPGSESIYAGEAYRFSLYHLLRIKKEKAAELFPVEIVEVGKDGYPENDSQNECSGNQNYPDGAKYLTISIAGARDPIFIRNVDSILQAAREEIRAKNEHVFPSKTYELNFRIYGKNLVLGTREKHTGITAHELGIIIEVYSQDRKTSKSVCASARSTLLHYGYDGRVSTAGNLAFPFSPSDFEVGWVKDNANAATADCGAADTEVAKKLVTDAGAGTRLIDVASVIRSKNAGIDKLTLDVIFKSSEDFKKTLEGRIINEKMISALYNIPDKDIAVYYYPPANAIKVTMRRPLIAGDPGETDVYGAQQYAPLFDIVLEDFKTP